MLTKKSRKAIQEEVEEEYPNANEERLEIAVERRMKEANVDMFIELFKNNIRFFMHLLHTDLMQRVLEQKQRIEDEADELDDEELLIDSIDLSREHIENLFE